MNTAVDPPVEWMRRVIRTSTVYTDPFPHWQFNRVFPPSVMDDLVALPVEAPEVRYDKGTREYNNATRTYFNTGTRAQFQVAGTVTAIFQGEETVSGIGKLCGVNLDGSYLRIEFAQDKNGFWLEPHTDIRVKLFSMLVYLTNDPETPDLGTDIYDREKRWVKRMPFIHNHALVFVPGGDTWHGFEKRIIKGVRKTLIINYVSNEWRDRYELAYPERPVRSI